MKKYLQSSWMVSLVGCIVYLTTTAVVLSSVHFEGILPEAEALPPDDAPSWRFRNPEFEQWVQDLQREKSEYEQRKAQLSEWETRLHAERQELTAITQRVAQLQMEFERNVIRLRDQEMKNLKRQAKTMADMSPDAALSLLEQMSDNDAARLLSVMKTDQATVLLETMSKSSRTQAKRAAEISDRMRRVLPDPISNSTPAPL